MEYEVIIADFQQYYNLDVRPIIQHEFRRFSVLLLQLPPESRFMQKIIPSRDWNWDKEVQSRILQTLDAILCQLANLFRKSGQESLKPGEQFQPDYVKRAKEEAQSLARAEAAISNDEMVAMKTFWQAHNYRIKASNNDS